MTSSIALLRWKAGVPSGEKALLALGGSASPLARADRRATACTTASRHESGERRNAVRREAREGGDRGKVAVAEAGAGLEGEETASGSHVPWVTGGTPPCDALFAADDA